MSHQFFCCSGYARFSGPSNVSLAVTVILMDGICAECSQRFKPFRGIQGNADSIAESDSTRIFIHDFVIAFLTQLAIRVRLFLVIYKNSRVKSDNDLISVSLMRNRYFRIGASANFPRELNPLHEILLLRSMQCFPKFHKSKDGCTLAATSVFSY